MKSNLPVIAASMMIAAIASGLFWRTGHDSRFVADGRATKSNTELEFRKSHDAPQVAKNHLRRPTLEESLPLGAKLAESNGKSGCVEVALADEMHLRAAGASVTENGVAFRGPYELVGKNGLSMTSENDQSYLFISRDGKTVKAGGATTTTPPTNQEDAEQVGASDGEKLQN